MSLPGQENPSTDEHMQGEVSESNKETQLQRGRMRPLKPRKFGHAILAGGGSCMPPAYLRAWSWVLLWRGRKAVTSPSFINSRVVRRSRLLCLSTAHSV